jgi:hypothetical protein
MTNTITDLKSARAVVAYETTRNKVVYDKYIAANGVTLETVSAHVKALQELAFPDFDAKTADDETKYARKSFGNRVRNGLNTHLGKVVPSKREETTDAEETATDGEESAESAPTATVEATPAQSLALALQAAQAAGMTRDEILAVVADVVAVHAVAA